MMIWGAFSVSSVQAVTVYQQFLDSSGDIYAELSNSPVLLGSFEVSQQTDIVDSEIQLVWTRVSGCPSFFGNAGMIIDVSTSSNPAEVTNTAVIEYAGRSIDGSPLLCNGSSEFVVGTTTTVVQGYYTDYIPGTTYYVWNRNSNNEAGNFASNLSGDFFYGYITAGGFSPSIPILPGLPGYTDVGISTTSQQVYCNQNFSTTTGLLDSVGQSISLGICNVSVFLFVPSNAALLNYSNLASTTQEKIPFSYYYDFKDILDGSSASSSTNFTALAVNLGSTGVGSTSPYGAVLTGLGNFSFLSTTTIMTYISQSTYDLLFLLMRSAIWVAVMFHIYRRFVPKHATSV